MRKKEPDFNIDDSEEKTQPELADIIEMIKRYSASNKNKVCFIASFVAFKETSKRKCSDCGENCDHEISDEGSSILAYGDKETLREILNNLRDMTEDFSEAEETDFINI